MYCKKCGKQIDEGAAFCPKCGTPVKESAGAQKEEKGRKTAGRKRIAAGAVIAIAAIALLVIIISGKKDKYSGYYICNINGQSCYAIQIDGDRVTGYGTGTLPYHEGSISTTDSHAYADFTDRDWERYSPFTITLSEDGRKMYFSSDDSRWSTDTYYVVGKSEYESFLQEYLAEEVEEHLNGE